MKNQIQTCRKPVGTSGAFIVPFSRHSIHAKDKINTQEEGIGMPLWNPGLITRICTLK